MRTHCLLGLGLAAALTTSNAFTRSPIRQRHGVLARRAAETFSFELTLDDGAVERVTLAAEDDAAAEAARVVAKHPAAHATAANLEQALREQWRAVMPELYLGPSPSGGAPLKGLVASVPVAASGLVLDVAESLAAPGAGCGVFVRKANAAGPDVTLFGGQPLCGYGKGRMSDTAVAEGGKTIVFRLDSLQSNVFFRNRLVPLRAVLEEVAAETHGKRTATPPGEGASPEAPAVAVAAHVLTWSDDGKMCTGIAPDPHYCGPYRFFVPEAESLLPDANIDAQSFTAMSVGQMCNDLAVAAGSSGLVVRPTGSTDSTATSEAAGSVASDRPDSRSSESSESSGRSERDGGKGPNEALYAAAAEHHNLLVLTHCLETLATQPPAGNPGGPGHPPPQTLLVPRAPVLTLTRSATFASAAPAELGCKYGYEYWAPALSGTSR